MSETLAEKARRIAKRVQEVTTKAIEYPSTLVHQATPEEALANDLKLAQLRNNTEMFAAPKAFWVENNVPGMRYAGEAMRKLDASHRDAPEVDAGELDEPAVRQPVQMQREFSNDKEKEAYLERIRQAQKNAAAAK